MVVLWMVSLHSDAEAVFATRTPPLGEPLVLAMTMSCTGSAGSA